MQQNSESYTGISFSFALFQRRTHDQGCEEKKSQKFATKTWTTEQFTKYKPNTTNLLKWAHNLDQNTSIMNTELEVVKTAQNLRMHHHMENMWNTEDELVPCFATWLFVGCEKRSW